jgi:RNA polymerase sigma factor (sigma-70 family)
MKFAKCPRIIPQVPLPPESVERVTISFGSVFHLFLSQSNNFGNNLRGKVSGYLAASENGAVAVQINTKPELWTDFASGSSELETNNESPPSADCNPADRGLRRLSKFAPLACATLNCYRPAAMADTAFDEAQCLAHVREQDEDAARSLVEHLYPTVIRVVRRNLPRRGAEEDLAQEIFVKMFEKLDQYRGEVPLVHWVSRIAVNHCLNAIRAQKVRPEWRMADLSEEQAATLDAVTSDAHQAVHPSHLIGARELVEMLLNALSPADRLLIQLLEIDELSTEQVCEATGWSAPYIRVRAFRARRSLNKKFGALRKKGRL